MLKIKMADILKSPVLDLSTSFLTSLPESISNLKELKKLYLQDNNLTQLPESIGNLSKLQVLFLDSNPLTHLPESIGNLQELRHLNLANTNLTHLPETLANLPNLEVLDLSNTGITSEKQLPGNFRNLQKLKSIILNDTFETGNKSVVEYLKHKRVKVALSQLPQQKVQSKNSQTQQQTRDLRRKYNELKRDNSLLNEQNVELAEIILNNSSIIDNLKNDNRDISKTIVQLTNKSQALQDELDRNVLEYTKILQQKQKQKHQQYQQKQNRPPKRQVPKCQDNKALQQQLGECNNYNSELIQKLSENSIEIKLLKSTIAKNKAIVKNLEEDVSEQNAFIEELNQQNLLTKHKLEKMDHLKKLMSYKSLNEKSRRDINNILTSFEIDPTHFCNMTQ